MVQTEEGGTRGEGAEAIKRNHGQCRLVEVARGGRARASRKAYHGITV